MKILLFIAVLFISLAGCNKQENSQINYEAKNTPYSESTQKISGTYSTKITDKTSERLNNIQQGVSNLNGATINPGEEFSFNNQVGPRNKETGFEKAIIFDGHGNKVDGYGGGVCQISSTLYNALLSAGLPVTERHEHSRSVPYIEDGKDASVSFGSDDLKFKNTSNKQLKISANTDNDTLTITIEEI